MTVKTGKKSVFVIVLCCVLAAVAASVVIFADIGISSDISAAKVAFGRCMTENTGTGAECLKDNDIPVTRRRFPEKVLVGGIPFGVKYYADGVLVVGMNDVETASGRKNPADAAGIKVKDVILSVNGQSADNESFSEAVRSSNGRSLTLQIKRENVYFDIKVQPVQDLSGIYRLGCLVRDSTAGIGTVTYIDPESGTFAGLGHAICDVDTGEIMTLSHATVYGAVIHSVVQGKVGAPGELKGSFDDDVLIGSLYKNCEQGVFGKLDDSFVVGGGKMLEVANTEEIKEGEALICCTLDDCGPQYYRINITKVYSDKTRTSRNMIIKVTDEKLLEKTGGIVQGMSGSPVIQNGKLVGAVTHVMVNDPTRGYGISIENMLHAG